MGVLDDGPVRREGRVGGRHLRERLRARARRVEDLPHALQPDVRGPLCDRLAQRGRGPEDRPLSLHPGRDRHPRARPARVGGGSGTADEPGHGAHGPRAAHRGDERGGQGPEPPERLRLLHGPQDVGRRHGPVHGRRRALDCQRRRLRRSQEHSPRARAQRSGRTEAGSTERAHAARHGGDHRARRNGSAVARARVRPAGRSRQRCSRRDGVLHARHLREPLREAERHLADPRDATLPADEDRLRAGLGEEPGASIRRPPRSTRPIGRS